MHSGKRLFINNQCFCLHGGAT